jgi:hypothetical protein
MNSLLFATCSPRLLVGQFAQLDGEGFFFVAPQDSHFPLLPNRRLCDYCW